MISKPENSEDNHVETLSFCFLIHSIYGNCAKMVMRNRVYVCLNAYASLCASITDQTFMLVFAHKDLRCRPV